MAILLKSWVALAAFPIALLSWTLVVGNAFPLKTVAPAAVSAARRSAMIQASIAVALIFAAVVLLGSK
ncbi:hypothetical protein D0B54_04410 [Solimonas sp. K1W22B-7]|uniref:hypothetical protein n=1 Tax=Solimonas sp. K1W22B-7 TaxID=2303331 RepID=UPI000E3374F0|nr:hypothetical protein [Solimonas sp. K1W22B-7]AXQ27963.1 hypothetical protein D0B54_04410 [Solimonas sp. K1W22B-7]